MTFQYVEYQTCVAIGREVWHGYRERYRDYVSDKSLPDSPDVDLNQSIKDLDLKMPSVEYRLHSGFHQTFCEHCRRLLQGTGHPAGTIIHLPESRLFYSHWVGYYLSKSALSGCRLCLLMYRAFGSTILTSSGEEEFAGSFDFARYLSIEENVNRFVLRFFRYAIVSDGLHEVIKRTHYSSMTLQNMQCEAVPKAPRVQH